MKNTPYSKKLTGEDNLENSIANLFSLLIPTASVIFTAFLLAQQTTA